ncbi:hypothetical protein [Ruegeria hyattellae]|uniref:hypothetical protein n=1 Tax=Ruegeria hyattellae TaxID=3233337 RepID=UPI00355C54C3
MDEHSITYIALTKWAPPLITIFVGGLMASILFPRWQDRYNRHRAREDRKLALAEEVAQNMKKYIQAWNRLRAIAELEASRPDGLTEVEFERKKSYVEERSNARDELHDNLVSAQLYFSADAQAAIGDFFRWDERCSELHLDQLPERSEFAVESRKVVSTIHAEIEA